jgi:ABC-type branched-subunit amino acid transport system ATPase component
MSVIELKGITKTFGGLRAVDDLSLSFEPGKITCLIGPNAAGKTTVFDIICGFLRPDLGRVFYLGEDITDWSPWRIAREGVGRFYQGVRVYGSLSVLDNVMAAFRGQMGERALMSVVARWRVVGEEARLKARGLELLESVGLQGRADAAAGELSFGQQKLLALARLIASEADVILLDEPTAGINPKLLTEPPEDRGWDAGARTRTGTFIGLIRKFADEGKTVIIIEHNMSVVYDVADWVHFMERGRLVTSGKPGDVLGNLRVKSSYIENLAT